MLIGYARVSTAEQDVSSQVAALKRGGVRKIVREWRSGASDRPELEKLLLALKPDDVLVVYKVDRLARSLRDLLRVLEVVSRAGASFRSLTEPIETATPAGRMLVQLLGAFAEFERAIIRERCHAGRVAARERGVQFGRPKLVEGHELRPVLARGLTQAEAAAHFGVSSHAIRRCARANGLTFLRDGRGGRRAPLTL